MKRISVLMITTAVVLSSCVSQKKYTELEGNYKKAGQELVDTKADLMKCRIESEGKLSAYEIGRAHV